jgi:capsular polysaccharide biosynthesis protein
MNAEMPLGAEYPQLLRAVLRHHWPAIVVAVVVGAVVGTAVGLANGQSYQSSATVLIAPLEGIPYSPESVARQSQANTDALTDARLAATPAVARLVERSLGLPQDSLAWRSNLAVEVVPNSQVVKIGYRSSSARRARQRAHAFATDYLRYRAIRSQASVSGQLHSLESQARKVQRRLTRTTRALASSPTPAHRASLNQQVAIYTDQLAALSVQTAQLAGASRDPGQVLTPAGSPAATGVPTAALTLVGAIVGLLSGLAFAVVRESRDRRLREPSEVESAGLPLLATLKLSPSAPPDAEEIERYRTLRTAVLTHAPAPRVIEVCALAPMIEAGDVAAGLGTALARAGSEATVVLTSPGSSSSGEPGAGLAEVLLEDAHAREVREKVAPGLYLLEPGRQIEAGAEMFATEKLRATFRHLAGSDGYVLVAAPVTGTTASTALAVVCDEVILISPLEDSSVQDLTTAVREVQRLGGHVLGAVAVEPASQGAPHLRKVSSSLPRITRASVARWRSLADKRTSKGADTRAEHRLRALSTVAADLEHRVAQAGSVDVVAAPGSTAKPATAASSERRATRPTKDDGPASSEGAVGAAEVAEEEVGPASRDRSPQATEDASAPASGGAIESTGAAGAPTSSGDGNRSGTTKRAGTNRRSSTNKRKTS